MIIELLLAVAAIQSEPPTLKVATTAPELPPLAGTPAEQCAQGLAERRFAEAVEPCRVAVAAKPGDIELLRTAATVEFNSGNGAESAVLWSRALGQGWSIEASQAQAMALWRAGDKNKAETVLRDNLNRAPSGKTALELIRFLAAFGRNDEAIALAQESVPLYPDTCEIEEMRGVAEAAQGHHEAAAAAYARAIEAGCPTLGWTGLGAGAASLDHPAYRTLLDPEVIVDGLDQLDDDACLKRLTLLQHTMDPKVAQPVLQVALNRETSRVRMAALGLLAQLGASAPDVWPTLLASEDFLLRKHTLRRINSLRDPAFIPLLEEQLEKETTRGNRSLVSLGLGELYLDQGKVKEGLTSLESIPSEDPLFIKAQLVLADAARDSGDASGELFHLERVRDAAPETFLEVERLEALRQTIGPETEVMENAPAVVKVKETTAEDTVEDGPG